MTPFAGVNQVTSLYGYRTNPITKQREFHMGEDMVAHGAVYTEPWMVRETTGNGTVIEASYGYNYGRGNLVRVQYPDGYVACYQHLHRIDVKVGDRVEQGHRLGLAGQTGDSDGVHLHFEVRTAPGEGGQCVDPSPWSGVPNVIGNHPGNDNLDNPAPAPQPEPEPQPTPTPAPTDKLAIGREINLNGAKLYPDAYTETATNVLPDPHVTGVVNPFYIHGAEVNGRVPITNVKDWAAQEVTGENTTGYISVSDVP